MESRRHGAKAPFHRPRGRAQRQLGVLLALAAVGPVLLGLVSTSGAAGAAPLSVSSYASPGIGPAPLNVYFQANVSGGTGVYPSVEWSFGDGDVAGGISVRHVYQSGGTYDVTLEVFDSSGTSAWANLTVHVAPNGVGTSLPTNPPTAGPSFSLSFVVGLALGAGSAAAGTLAFWRIRAGRAAAPGAILPGPHRSGPTLAEAPNSRSDRTFGPSSGATSPPAGVAPVVTSTREPRRISEEVVVHLRSLGRLTADDLADPFRTQPGMVARLEVPQNVLSPVLRRLTDAGVVRDELRHVRGRARRLKVYTLTDRGDALAREIRLRRSGSVGAPAAQDASFPRAPTRPEDHVPG